MADQRTGGIAWTEKTWNPLRGCSLVSAGCSSCYAMRRAHRFAGPGQPYEGLTRPRAKGGPVWTGEIKLVPEHLGDPLRWRKPQRIFVNSMSDLFHEGVPFEYIAAVFGVMAAAPQHVFQVLTKRPARAAEFFAWLESRAEQAREIFGSDDIDWRRGHILHRAAARVGVSHRRFALDEWVLPNVWLGVSVEDQASADARIPLLLTLPAAVRWVSLEPQIGPVDFRKPWRLAQYLPSWGRRSDGLRGCDTCCNGDRCDNPGHVERRFCDACGGSGFLPERSIDWIVIGGESGSGARPFDVAWARSTIAQCREAGVACFVKQLGALPFMRFRDTIAWPTAIAPMPEVIGEGRRYRAILRDRRKGADPSEWPEELRVREYPEVRS